MLTVGDDGRCSTTSRIDSRILVACLDRVKVSISTLLPNLLSSSILLALRFADASALLNRNRQTFSQSGFPRTGVGSFSPPIQHTPWILMTSSIMKSLLTPTALLAFITLSRSFLRVVIIPFRTSAITSSRILSEGFCI